MKKLSAFAGIVLAAAMVVLTPATVKADGLPCTEDTIKQFSANLEAAKQELSVAIAQKAQADANVAALKAQGVSGLELLIATDAATNAANIVSAYQHKVNGAQASLDSIVSRGKTEQYVLDYEAKVKERCKLDSIKVQLDGANEITSAALTQLENVQAELVKAQVNAAANPSLAGNVPAFQSAVATAEASYLKAKANSDALAMQYANALNTLNFATDADNAAYVDFVENYATSLRVETVHVHADGTTETWRKYPGYNANNSGPMEIAYGVWSHGKPNEWAVRWWE